MDFETTLTRLRGRLDPVLRCAGGLLCGAFALAGCSGVQSALDPAGGDAWDLYWLTIVMTVGATLIFVVVTALLLYAVFAPPERRAWLGTRRTIVYGGLAFPIVTLSLLLPYGLIVMRDVDAPQPGALQIEVIGEQYWWRVRYPAEGEQAEFSTANELVDPDRQADHRVGDGGRRDPQLLDPEFRRQDRHDPGADQPPQLHGGTARHLSRHLRRVLRRPACAHGLRRDGAGARRIRRMAKRTGAAGPGAGDSVPGQGPRRCSAAAAAAPAMWCAAPKPTGSSVRI